MDAPDFSGFINEFLEEAEEHLQTLNSGLLEMERSGADPAGKRDKIDSLLRAAHTVKGLAGMMEFEKIEKVCHGMEDIFSEIRAGKMGLENVAIDPLFAAVDALARLIGEVREKQSDKAVDIAAVSAGLRNMLDAEPEAPPAPSTPKRKIAAPPPANVADVALPASTETEVDLDSLPITDKERTVLAEAAGAGLWIYEVGKEFVGGTSLERMERLPIFREIEKSGMLISSTPPLEDVPQLEGPVNCRILFSSDMPPETVRERFMDPVRALFKGSPRARGVSDERQKTPPPPRELSEIFRAMDATLINEFTRSAAGNMEGMENRLKDLERDPANLAVAAALLSLSHTIKTKAAVFGFNKIAVLAGRMETLFENMRGERITAVPEVFDSATAALAKLKGFLDEISNLKDSGLSSEKEVAAIDRALGKARRSPAQLGAALKNITLDNGVWDALSDAEKNVVADEASKSSTIYDVVIRFHEDVIKAGFEPLSIIPTLERTGDILVSIPLIEDVPNLGAFNVEKFGVGFRFLLASKLAHDDLLKRFEHMPKFMDISVTGIAGKTLQPARMSPRSRAALPAAPLTAPAPDVHDLPSTAEAERKIKDKALNTIRVDIDRLDALLNLIGELVIDRTRLEQIAADLRNKLPNDPLAVRMAHANQLLQRHMTDIQDTVMSVRMVPIGNAFGKFPRVVRDLAKALGKSVALVTSGEETELDKTLIEEMADPLLHLVRNAVDHGIEPPHERRAAGKPDIGLLTLKAGHKGDTIVIEIEDDGRGMDVERIRKKAIDMGLLDPGNDAVTEKDVLQFIFEPGFSTAERTTLVSGRGVGMDVVKKNIARLKGLISVDSTRGKGARVTLRLPLTLAIVPSLMIGVREETFAVPLASVVESVRVPSSDIHEVGGREVMTLRNEALPLVRLDRLFELDRKPRGGATPPAEPEHRRKRRASVFVVVVGIAEKRLGLIVDELKRQQEVVIKNLGAMLKHAQGISGATIMGDGRVALILDVGQIIEESDKRDRLRPATAPVPNAS